MLPIVTAEQLPVATPVPIEPAFEQQVAEIVRDVQQEGDQALRRYAERLDGLSADQPLVIPGEDLRAALDQITAAERALLERTAARIERFARAQRASVSNVELVVPGGRAGQQVIPVASAGCYAPGGGYPLVSSVLMTVVTARAAGVARVIAATPKASPLMQAAAAIAGADALLVAGGAQAIAALAYGTESVPRCAAVVGPGNRWVTAAKRLVSGETRIDMLAGPSELVVWADESARADWIAADLLAQAEHDREARPILVTSSPDLAREVQDALRQQIEELSTHEIARAALENGAIVPVEDLQEGAAVVNHLAPEHLELQLAQPREALQMVQHYGCAFVGSQTAEVLGDYGAGPNHTLPTGGTARCVSGLSVFSFLRMPTWLEMDDAGDPEVFDDALALAEAEGLAGHRTSVAIRMK